ncbi:MAG: hypothetical protein JJU33_14810 [Phycisphaerales bacterium]|nr:hypothetical protein [Phycisphaerales bacterium]
MHATRSAAAALLIFSAATLSGASELSRAVFGERNAVATSEPTAGQPGEHAGYQAPADHHHEPMTRVGLDPWRIDLTAWVWLLGVDGDLGVGSRRASVSASFGDILSDSDSLFAYSGRMELGYSRWGVFVDGIHAEVGADDVRPLGVEFLAVDIKYQMTILDFGVLYRLGEWAPPAAAASSPRSTTLDLYAGARYTDLDVELDFREIPLIRREVSWFDPIVGARLDTPLADRLRLTANGDVGGFGIGSNFAWSATGVLGYDFPFLGTHGSVYLGYRAIGHDYSTGSGERRFKWDIIQHGPLVGLSLWF